MTALPLVHELTPPPDPAATCERFLGQPHLIFLDSATAPAALSRYSWLSADPAAVIRSKGAGSAGPPFDQLRDFLRQHHTEAVAGLPPFQGGAAGFLAYDLGESLETISPPRYDDLALPDVALGLYDWTIAWDHVERRAWIISTGLPEGGAEKMARAAERLAWVQRLIAGPPARRLGGNTARRLREPAVPTHAVLNAEQSGDIGLRSVFTHEEYLTAVARVREYILAGDIFQANLTQRLEASLEEDPWQLYRRMREVNPAPFAAYIESDGFAVVSASPERFLELDPSGRVETRPIKGTRPRGLSPAHDAALSQDLLESEKDRAENLMIVDLLRNDLSRVCEPSSVQVPELFALEQFRTVHHLVSTVVGQLAPGRDAVDLLRATFPGGSITGAPKVRAMEIIAELEPARRGVYCGAVGYLSVTGAMDTSIAIRTVVATGGKAYFSVGGGIVADSDPENEYQETLHKARGIIATLAGAVETP